MRLIVHAGLHKTGTSSLQRHFRRNQKAYIEQGLYYPRELLRVLDTPSSETSEGGHVHFTKILENPNSDFSKKFLGKIVKKSRELSCHTVIISSETILAPRMKIHESAARVLRSKFEQIEIVTYLRRQDKWADSFYREYITWPRQRETRCFETFCSEELLPTWLNYENRLAEFDRIFGTNSMKVMSYDDRKHKDLVEDFIEVFQLPNIKKLYELSTSNISLPYAIVDFVRELNAQNLSNYAKSRATRRVYHELRYNGIDVTTRELSSPSLGAKVSEFEAQNKRIAKHYNMSNYEKFVSLSKQSSKAVVRGKSISSEVQDKILEEAKSRSKVRTGFEKNDGSFGISVLSNESPKQLCIFLDYHLSIGASNIIVFLDNPKDRIVQIYQDNQVEFVLCDKSFWQEQIGRLPENNAEKLQVVHSLGLDRLRFKYGLNWALNIDADELLWVRAGQTAKNLFSKLSPKYNQILIYPAESIFVDEKDANIFAAKYFKFPRYSPDLKLPDIMSKGGPFLSKLLIKFLDIVPREYGLSSAFFNLSNFVPKIGRNFYLNKAPFYSWSSKDEECYKSAFPQIHTVLRKGFYGHQLGRTASSVDRVLDPLSSSHRHATGNSLTKRSNTFNQMMILHFDAVDFDAWHLKWYRREFGDARVYRIGEERRMQQALFRQAYENGETQALFRKMFFLNKSLLPTFLKRKLIRRIDIPNIAEIKKKWDAEFD